MSIFIKGKVVGGGGIGKKIGFPTLNIGYEGEERGVFVGEVVLDGEVYKSAVHVGAGFYSDEVMCEAYLLDFDGEVELKREVVVELKEKIRESKKFGDILKLKDQISKDVGFVKNWYNSGEN